VHLPAVLLLLLRRTRHTAAATYTAAPPQYHTNPRQPDCPLRHARCRRHSLAV